MSSASDVAKEKEMLRRDLYKELGVERTASEKEIKKVFFHILRVHDFILISRPIETKLEMSTQTRTLPQKQQLFSTSLKRPTTF